MFLKINLKLLLLQIFLHLGSSLAFCNQNIKFENFQQDLELVVSNHLKAFLQWKRFAKYPDLFKFIKGTGFLKKNPDQESVLNWRMFQDISILNGDEFSKEASVIRLLPVQPKTVCGYLQLFKTLSNPLVCVNSLKARRNFIDSFFSPQHPQVLQALDCYIKNHDTCLDFIYKDHTQDKTSSLNPKHGLYWNPIATTEGFKDSIVKGLFKFFKLEKKFGIKSSVVLKKQKDSPENKGNNFLTKKEKDSLDAFWVTMVLRCLVKLAWYSFWRLESFQTHIGKLSRRLDIAFIRWLDEEIGDAPPAPLGSPRMDVPRNRNGQEIKVSKSLKFPFSNWCTPLFLWEFETALDVFKANVNAKRLVPFCSSGWKVIKKSVSPIMGILELGYLFCEVYSTLRLLQVLTFSMKRDFEVFVPLVENFFKMSDLIIKACEKDGLELDPIFQKQLFELAGNQTLLALHSRFKSYKGSVVNLPRALQNYKFMYSAKPELIKLLAFYGQLEVFSCANDLGQLPEFSRPQFVESDHAQLELDGLWSLQLGPDESVKTSFELGRTCNSAIITGSNAGGKSFFMRNVLTSVLLSQTLLFAPCSKIELTPFAKLYSFIKKEDDPANGLSLHWCECAEIGKFNAFLQQLPKDQFVLAIMDELFSGTSSDKAAELFAKFVNSVKGSNNLLGLYTTHSTKSLERLNFFENSGVKFCKFGVNRDSQGIFRSYKYMPEDGVAGEFEDTAMDVARMAGMRI